MYEPFFKLKDRPFPTGPSASRYFPAGAIEQARQQLTRCIQRGQGAGLLVGPTGTGKTLLCHVLAQQFRGTHHIVLLAGAKLCTRRALLQSILFELGMPFRDQSEGELRLSLMSRLDPATDPTAGLLLIVDEADTLPTRLLEELRMMTNIVRDGAGRVQLVLAGATALEERFTNPKFESFNQRIAARCYLQPLLRDEAFNYIAWQVQRAGGDPYRVFDRSALLAAYETTEGIPRLINQLCDYALHSAAAAGEQPLTGATIAQAWSDLQQLPSPWASHATPRSAVGEPVASASADRSKRSEPSIEFAELSELPSLSGATFEPPAAEVSAAGFELPEFGAATASLEIGAPANVASIVGDLAPGVDASSDGTLADDLPDAVASMEGQASTAVGPVDESGSGESTEKSESAVDANDVDLARTTQQPEAAASGEAYVAADADDGSFLIYELPADPSYDEARIEATIGADLTIDVVDPRPMICQTLVGEEFMWPVVPASETSPAAAEDGESAEVESAATAGQEPAEATVESVESVEAVGPVRAEESRLQIVRADEEDEDEAEEEGAANVRVPVVAAAPVVPPREPRFHRLFSRLRRRASA